MKNYKIYFTKNEVISNEDDYLVMVDSFKRFHEIAGNITEIPESIISIKKYSQFLLLSNEKYQNDIINFFDLLNRLHVNSYYRAKESNISEEEWIDNFIKTNVKNIPGLALFIDGKKVN